jgi:hypothetical protein
MAAFVGIVLAFFDLYLPAATHQAADDSRSP